MALILANKFTWLQVYSALFYLVVYHISKVCIAFIYMQHTERAVQRGWRAGVNGEWARQVRAGGQGKLGTVGGACAKVPGVL